MEARRPHLPLLLLTALASLLLPASGRAQAGGGWTTLASLDGFASGDYFGYEVAVAGDVDGDGVPDLLVGAPFADPGGMGGAGEAYVFSGATFQLLLSWGGSAPGNALGWAVSGAGDVDGDGHADVLVAEPWASPGGVSHAGWVYLFSGRDGSVLRRYDGFQADGHFAEAVANAGDVDGDGVPDQILGAIATEVGGQTYAGAAWVYSGASGAQLYSYQGIGAYDYLGEAVAGGGDVDGDGRADFLISLPGADAGGVPDAGRVRLYSGATGTLLMEYHGLKASNSLGSALAFVPDVDGDGLDDVLIGSESFETYLLGLCGQVQVSSSATGATLWRMHGSSLQRLGSSVAVVPDVTGDGVPEVAVGAPGYLAPGSGHVYLISADDGVLVSILDGSSYGSPFGRRVAATDLDGDGIGEVFVGAYSAGGSGRAWVLTFQPWLTASAERLSAAAGGTVIYSLDFPDTEAGRAYQVLASATGRGPSIVQGLDIPLTTDGMFWRTWAGTYPPYVGGAGGVLDAQGDATCTVAPGPGVLNHHVGATIYVAAVSFAPGGAPALSSIAADLTIDP